MLNVINASISDYKKNNKRKFFHDHEMRKCLYEKNNKSDYNIEKQSEEVDEFTEVSEQREEVADEIVIEEEDNESEQSEDFDELIIREEGNSIADKKKDEVESAEVNVERDNRVEDEVDAESGHEVNIRVEAITTQEKSALEVEEKLSWKLTM